LKVVLTQLRKSIKYQYYLLAQASTIESGFGVFFRVSKKYSIYWNWSSAAEHTSFIVLMAINGYFPTEVSAFNKRQSAPSRTAL
jgi:hypothetical protein